MATHSLEAIGKADTIVRLQDGRVQSVSLGKLRNAGHWSLFYRLISGR